MLQAMSTTCTVSWVPWGEWCGETDEAGALALECAVPARSRCSESRTCPGLLRGVWSAPVSQLLN